MQYVRSLGRWDKGLIDQAFDLAQRTSVLYCGLSYSNTLLVSIHGPQYSLVMHSCQKIPLQYLLSSLNALISTNKRHWIIASHAIFYVFMWQFFQFSSKISKKKKILRQKSKEFQRFLPIFSNFKQNKQFLLKNSENFQGFYNPNRKCNSWQGFYCVFMWQFFQISSQISKIFLG